MRPLVFDHRSPWACRSGRAAACLLARRARAADGRRAKAGPAAKAPGASGVGSRIGFMRFLSLFPHSFHPRVDFVHRQKPSRQGGAWGCGGLQHHAAGVKQAAKAPSPLGRRRELGYRHSRESGKDELLPGRHRGQGESGGPEPTPKRSAARRIWGDRRATFRSAGRVSRGTDPSLSPTNLSPIFQALRLGLGLSNVRHSPAHTPAPGIGGSGRICRLRIGTTGQI